MALLPVHPGRFSAHIEGDFVVFLLGAKFHRFWKIHKWLPIALAMHRMMRELETEGKIGLLHSERFFSVSGFSYRQYWRSFDHLNRFARDTDGTHLGAWSWFSRKVGASKDVGIWHETFLVRAGEYECIYTNMPRVGLARGCDHLPVQIKGQAAAKRLGLSETDDPALPPF